MSDLDHLLCDLGITPNLLGYRYLKDAVHIVTTSDQAELRVVGDMYPVIAVKYGTTPTGVERAIRHAISKAIEADYGNMRNLIGLDSRISKATNAQFIYSLVNASK